MVVDQVYVPLPPVIRCQVPFSRVWTAVGGGPPVTVTVKWNVVAVVPLVGDTLPVKTVVPHENATTWPGTTNRPSSTTLIASVAIP
jgi:hypothetical protein